MAGKTSETSVLDDIHDELTKIVDGLRTLSKASENNILTDNDPSEENDVDLDVDAKNDDDDDDDESEKEKKDDEKDENIDEKDDDKNDDKKDDDAVKEEEKEIDVKGGGDDGGGDGNDVAVEDGVEETVDDGNNDDEVDPLKDDDDSDDDDVDDCDVEYYHAPFVRHLRSVAGALTIAGAIAAMAVCLGIAAVIKAKQDRQAPPPTPGSDDRIASKLRFLLWLLRPEIFTVVRFVVVVYFVAFIVVVGVAMTLDVFGWCPARLVGLGQRM